MNPTLKSDVNPIKEPVGYICTSGPNWLTFFEGTQSYRGLSGLRLITAKDSWDYISFFAKFYWISMVFKKCCQGFFQRFIGIIAHSTFLTKVIGTMAQSYSYARFTANVDMDYGSFVVI